MKFLLGLMILAFLTGVLIAEPSIAVLDAILEEGVDDSARVPVTEKIIEELVSSGKYTVLDRGSVQQILEEKKFQLSGIVKDTEIKQAGEYLGADFVCVAKVSRIGGTYFISAKIISVETGAITAQTSHEEKGDIETVLVIAKIVGVALSGGTLEPIPDEVVVIDGEFDDTEPVIDEGKMRPKSHLVASYLIPVFMGDAYDTNITDVNAIAAYYGTTYNQTQTGFDLHWMQMLAGLFYVSGGLGAGMEDVYFTSYDEIYTNFLLMNLRAGLGAAFSITKGITVYGGGGFAYLITMFQDLWDLAQYVFTNIDGSLSGEMASGGGFFAEAGVDLILLNFLTINAAVQYVSGTISGDFFFYDGWPIGQIGVSVGVGIAY